MKSKELVIINIKLFSEIVLIKLIVFPIKMKPNVKNENIRKLSLNVFFSLSYDDKNKYINENIANKNIGVPINIVENESTND